MRLDENYVFLYGGIGYFYITKRKFNCSSIGEEMMKKLVTLLLIIAYVLPRVLNINITVNNRINVIKMNKEESITKDKIA